MAKRKSAWLLVISLIAMMALTLTVFTSCASKGDGTDTGTGEVTGTGDATGTETGSENNPNPSKKNYTVTFMVRENGTGDYQKYKEVTTNDDGSVTMPADPEVEGLTFRAWYTDEACSEDKLFDGKKVESDMKVYAFLSDKVLTISIKDEAGKVTELKEQTVSSLEITAAAESKKAEEKNLVFISWYTNADCTTPYTNESGATTVYGRYMAKVTFNNGYENVLEQIIVPGETVEKPEAEKLAEKFKYMDKEDMFFVAPDDHAKEINFKDTISVNTLITVLWKTPGLEYAPISGTADYVINSYRTDTDRTAIESYPVISIPDRATVDNQLVNIKSLNAANLYLAKSAKMIIINDGIEDVYSLSGGMLKSIVEQVILPANLKILESSFRDMPSLKALELPEGLEVIFDCFWPEFRSDGGVTRSKGYENFEIVVPKSVNNISQVPTNLVYAEGSPFFNDGNRVYKNDAELGKVLVSQLQADVDDRDTLTIPEGVEAIQVGSLSDLKYDYLVLPSTFTKVSYNNDREAYPFYIGSRLTILSSVSNPDSDPHSRYMNALAYTIVNDLNDRAYVNFNSTAYPEGMNIYAFADSGESFENLETTKVVFVADIPTGEPVSITVNFSNQMTGEAQEIILNDVLSGDTLTQDVLLEKLGITVDSLGYEFKVVSLMQFGQNFDFEKPIIRNQYIDLEVAIFAKGFVTEDNGDGTLTVVGFDQESAKLLDNGVSYLVFIPAMDSGKTIVAIKDGAFENNDLIGQIYIPSTVKTIGARAFRNAKNLEVVDIQPGGLEVIGEAAFEYAGSVEVDGKRVINPSFTAADPAISLSVRLPLGAMKEIHPNAFNTPAILSFTQVDAEKDRVKMAASGIDETKLEPYNFYFQSLGDGSLIGIVRMLDGTPVTVTRENVDYTVYDMEYVATAGGVGAKSGTSLALGMNNKIFGASAYFRYTVKKGSVALYNGGLNGITFANVLKVEKDAFTYINEAYITPTKNGDVKISYAQPNGMFGKIYVYTTMDQIKTQDPSIFENGWFMGRDNAENESFMTIPSDGGGIPGFS